MNQATSSGSRWRIDALPVLVLAVVILTISVSGGGIVDALKVTLVIVVQSIGGSLLWLARKRGQQSSWPELLGMGFALGSILALVSSQLLRPTPLAGFAWALPTLAITLLFLGVWAKGHHWVGAIAPTDRMTLAVLGAGALGLLVFILGPWFLMNPLNDPGWHALYLDTPFYESLSRSLQVFGPNDSGFAAGEPVRYHWLSYAWAGSTSAASGAGPFVVVTRALPLVAGLAAICLTLAWVRKLGAGKPAATLAVALVLFCNDVGTGFGHVLFPESPSLIMSTVWLLAAGVVLTEQLKRPARAWYVLLAGLALACTGGKVSAGFALCGGLVLAALALRRNREVRRVLTIDAAVVIAVSGLVYVLTSAGRGGYRSGFGLGATAQLYEFVIGRSPLEILVGSLAVIAAVTAPWAGTLTLWVLGRMRRSPELWLGWGAGAVTLVAVLALDIVAGNQTNFPVSATALLLPLSAIGLAEGRTAVAASQRSTSVWLAAGLGLGVLGAVGSQVLPLGWRWFAPVFVALVAMISGVIAARSGAGVKGGIQQARRLGIWVTSVALVAASAGAGLTVAAFKYQRYSGILGAQPATAETPYAWNEYSTQAATWVERNIPIGDVMATNRRCSVPTATEANCVAYWFLTSALTGRRMLVEGTGLEEVPAWAQPRIAAQDEFLSDPSAESAVGLRDLGVRWIWVDKLATGRQTWEPWATVVYENPGILILRLNEESDG